MLWTFLGGFHINDNMIDRAYLEITNICNLNCIFCPKNERQKRKMTVEEFDLLTDRLKGQIKFLYFHLMGEPMLHEHLSDFIAMARDKGFITVITTNGTLLSKGFTTLPFKIQISLHSHEGNERNSSMADYINEVMSFAKSAAAGGTIVVLRLWNQGGFDSQNDHILELIGQHIRREEWTQRYDGWKIAEKIYVEYDQMFEWPEEKREAYDIDEVFCYALRNQIGIHVDGTVVPCCLDHDGSIPLGNLFEQQLEDILNTPRAKALYEGFSKHTATEALCQRCEYAAITKRFRRSK